VFDFLVGPLVTKSQKTKRAVSDAWTPEPSKINIVVEDSLTALTTRMEIDQGDKMGQRRAKEFSQGFRVAKGHFRKHNITAICTNQIRDDVGSRFGGVTTSGGHAVKFYSSCRIRLDLIERLKKEVDVRGRKHEQVYGIKVRASIIKNSLDGSYRTANLYIIFGYGIDDIRANLQFLKENGGFDEEENGKWKESKTYKVGDRKIGSLEKAVGLVEELNLEEEIRNKAIDLWEEIQSAFVVERKPKRKNA
jgi:recombination protein RecA